MARQSSNGSSTCSGRRSAAEPASERVRHSVGTRRELSLNDDFDRRARTDVYGHVQGSDHETFDLVSDMAGDAIEVYGLSLNIPDLGLNGAANRAVVVIDDEGTVTYRWVTEDPTNEPDYDALIDAVEAA